MQDDVLNLVTCPTCGTPFELSAAMQDAVARRVALEQGKVRQLAEATARERVTLEMQAVLDAKEAELAAAQLRSADALQREADVARRIRELDDREEQAALDIQRTLAAERTKIREQAEAAARERHEAHAKAVLEAKDAELAAARTQVADAAKREAELARRARELDDLAQQARLEVERTLADERTKVRQQAEETARARFDAQAAAEREARDADLAAAHAQVAAALAAKDDELNAARTQVADAARREAELARRARELDDRAQQAQLEIERTLADERTKIRQQAEETARAQTAAALAAKDDELSAARTQVANAARREAELARRAREVDDRAQQAQLEIERTLADERTKVRQQAEEAARARFDAQAAAEREARDADLAAARAQTAAALAAKDDELSAARAQVADAAKREAELARRARELDDRAQQAQLEIERTLADERTKVRQLAEEAALARFETQASSEREARDAELAAARAQIADARRREVDLIRQARELDDRVQQAHMDVERTLTAERAKIRQEAEAVAHARLDGEMKADRAARDAELAAARSQVAALTEREIEVLKRARDLEAREREQRLAFERRLSQETAQVKAATEAAVREHLRLESERHEAQAAEHHLQLEGLKRKLAEAQQKLSTATPYTRGETHEIQLRELLRRNFHRDRIEDVPVGTAGSDVVQGVVDELGREAGVIVWESKNTKLWSEEWLAKLRDDQRALGAELAVLASTTLPPDVRVFALREGVWVTSWQAAAPLAAVLRRTLLEVASVRNTNSSRGEKMSMLYDYLTGAEFRNRFTGVIEAYQEMQEDLDDERRAVLTLWKKRERQLKRAIENLAAFYGDVQGIAGAQLQDIDPLMLPSSQSRLAAPDGAGHDDDEVDLPSDLRRTLTELLYELIPQDGSTVGNKSLCSRFVSTALVRHHVTVGDAEYRSCKDMLLQLGRIRRGPGQGGSVARL